MLVCSKCKKRYSMDSAIWRCECGGVLDIEFEAKLDFGAIQKRAPNMWRYREAIPIEEDKNIVSFNEGFTPLVKHKIESQEMLLKLDYLFPSGSYKDRGASVLISKAKELGVKSLIEDSSGNAGCAIASYSAKAKIDCAIYVPKDTALAKLTQVKAYGARLNVVDGNRLETAKKAFEDAQNIYYASHTYNPFFYQGTKTLSFELYEQLQSEMPDYLFIPTGNGTLLIGAYLGFLDLQSSGLLKKMPKLIAVQAQNCAPLYKQYKDKLNDVLNIEELPTIAEGIAINKPLRGNQIIDIINKTNGDIVALSEQEIKKSLLQLSKEGFYVEPTSASAVAGFLKLKPKGRSIVILTGFGLKSNDKIQHIMEEN